MYIMRKYINQIVSIIVAGILFTACADDKMAEDISYEKGKAAVLNLAFDIPESNTVSISRASGETVKDLYLFVCSTDGTIESGYYFPKAGVSAQDENVKMVKNDSDEGGSVSGIPTTTGEHRIFAIGNCSGGAAFDIKSSLDAALQQKSDIMKVVAEMNQRTVSRGDDMYLMSGEYSDGSTNVVTVTSETETLTGNIALKRVDAKITFKVRCTNPDASFIPSAYEIYDLPSATLLLEQESESNGDLFEVSGRDFPIEDDAYTFSFYMAENKKTATETPTSYADRVNKAPKGATYLIIKGEYRGKSNIEGYDEAQDVTADVAYKIYLGNTNNDNYVNYTTERNSRYVYTVNVVGVNDISVDVKQEKTDHSDATGEILVANGGTPIEVDAHYGTVTLTFNKTSLVNQPDDYFTYYVYTPFCNLNATDDEKSVNAEWVKFVRNEMLAGGYLTTFANYADALKNEKLLSVQDLLDELKGNKNQDSFYDAEGKVVYTAYIDEYFYSSEPGEATEEPLLWKKFVNTENRKLMILAQTTSYNNSSVTEAAYVISQKAIQTIYNPDNSSLQKAFGIEVVEEEDKRLPDQLNTAGSDNTYGRINSINHLVGKKWSDIIDYTTGKLKDTYKYGAAACLQRNRDLDGDDIVDIEELRWYLPTVYQYQALFIGNYGLTQDARLYTDTDRAAGWSYKHYISSNTIESGIAEILWAEEGCSYGRANQSSISSKTFNIRCARDLGVNLSAVSHLDNLYTLDEDGKYEIYYDKSGTYGDGMVLDLSRLNSYSLRQDLYTKEVGEPYDTFSEGNKPYKKIAVASEYTNSVNWKDEESRANNGNGTCAESWGAGWRMPTVTELSLILQATGRPPYNLLTRTRFTYWDLAATSWPGNEGRYGHYYSSESNGTMRLSKIGENENQSGRIRCVKDIN